MKNAGHKCPYPGIYARRSIVSRNFRSVVLAAGLLLAGTSLAQDLDVRITEPRAGVPVFGQVAVTVDISPVDRVESVELFVDGERAGRVSTPPFHFDIDVGPDNRPHRFEVLARSRSGATGRAVVETASIRVDEEIDLDLQQLYVTVTRDQERVLDIRRDDFLITDHGKPQKIVTFERGEVPMVALLLLDASVSMEGGPLEMALEGAETFIDGMKPLDRAKLLLFSDRVIHTTPFTGFAQVLTTGLQSAAAAGGTALNDHLYLSLKLLEKRQGRRVIIILSDGVDVASVLSMRDVEWTARRSSALIYWIRFGNPNVQHQSAWRDAKQHDEERQRLEELVTRTGGRILSLGSIDETAIAFDNILRELREQYVLGYYPTHRSGDGSWHKVRVRVRRGGLEVRTRDGYLDN